MFFRVSVSLSRARGGEKQRPHVFRGLQTKEIFSVRLFKGEKKTFYSHPGVTSYRETVAGTAHTSLGSREPGAVAPVMSLEP